MFHQEFCLHYGPHHETITQNNSVCVDCQMLRSVGDHKIMVSRCTDFNCHDPSFWFVTKARGMEK
jgi:hypothetical protein